MLAKPQSYFERMSVPDLHEEFMMSGNLLGRTALICARPDFLRHDVHPVKEELLARYIASYDTTSTTPIDFDHANAHLVAELQRSAMLLTVFPLEQLQNRNRQDLITLLREDRDQLHTDAQDSLDKLHDSIRISPPMHAGE